MALLWMDGFEYTSTTEMYSAGWSYISISAPGSGQGRFSTYGLMTYQDADAGCRLTIADKTSLVVGMAVYDLNTVKGTNQRIFGLYDYNGYAHVFVNRNNSTNLLELYRGGTLLGTSTFAFLPTTWTYMELKATIHSSTGSAELRVNGATVLSLSNINTNAGGTGIINQVVLGATNGYQSFRKYHDDLYICDTSGSVNNDFLGDSRVITLSPTAVGDITQFTPSAGNNWECVDDMNDDDTTYVSASASGNKDLYNVANLPITPSSVHGVSVISTARKSETGTAANRNILKTNGTIANGSTNYLSTSYNKYITTYEINPVTSTAWSVSDVNNLQIGIERTI